MVSVLKPLCFYRVVREAAEPNELGGIDRHDRELFFQVNTVMKAKNRAKTMHTVFSADDLLRTAPLVVNVTLMDRWVAPEGTEDDGKERVLLELDDHFLLPPPKKIVPFEDLAHRLYVYHNKSADPAHQGCIVLADMHHARPPYALDDDRCPTLQLVSELGRQNWVKVLKTVTHTALPLENGPAPEFDSREAVRMKYYYMCVLHLSRVLPLTGNRLPSQQCVVYYRLLMRGQATVPDLTSKEYTLLWNRKRGRAGKDLLPLPPVDTVPPVPVDLGDEDFAVLPSGYVVAKRHSRGGVGRRGGGAGSGRGRHGGPGGGGGGEPPPIDFPVCPPVADPPAPVVGFEEEEDFGVAPAPVRPPKKEKEPFDWQAGINGAVIGFHNWVNPEGVAVPNWRIKCPNPAHVLNGRTCEKRRGAGGEFEARHGPIEPIAFLHCWLLINWPTDRKYKSHRFEPVPVDMLDRFVEEHRAELQAILERSNR